MDLKTIHARVKHEGVSFLTITLTDFGKDFEKSLDQGYVDRSQFLGFSRTGGLPRFLGGFLDQVFDRGTGRLIDTPSIDAIRAVRQITLMFGKISLKCSPARERAAITRYINCEKEMRTNDSNLSIERLLALRRVSNVLFGDLFLRLDKEIYEEQVLPKHGPGSTADGLRGNLKYAQQEWPARLEGLFPMGSFLRPNWLSFLDSQDSFSLLEPGAERPVKVITVPKTLKTPRIIAQEPTAMMYVQQGILELLTNATEDFTIPRMLISSKSQIPNQELAQKGSRDGSLATLDLSEASDRVSNQHVRSILTNYPSLFEAVDSSRSRKADVDGHGVIRLAKFASMGSALCFPFEAIVFTTVIFLAVERTLNRHLTKKDVYALLGQVRVYGDDIIIPVDLVSAVIEELEAFGFKVNSHKSFWTGMFRESCGKEYYQGHDVSIVRVREMLPSSRRDTSEIVSTVSFLNQAKSHGLYGTVEVVRGILERFIPLPRVASTSQALGEHVEFDFSIDSMCPRLQIPDATGTGA